MRLKILVVEDDPIQSENLARLLGSFGYHAEVAGDGREAVRRLCTGSFHVALIDYRLPELDGLGIVRVIRNMQRSYEQPRLIALTSAPQDLVADAAEFDEILNKPIELNLLLQAIERGRPTGEAAQAAQAQPGECATVEQRVLALPDVSTEVRGRILLADDDEHLREFLRLTLQHHGFEVDVVEDGLQAIGQICTSAYDVVIVDFNMPRLDGLAAAKIIYDLVERRTRPRIVALTSTPDSLVAQDPRWRLVLDEVVSKAGGVPAILLAVEQCINYKALRSKEPLDILGLQSLNALAQSVGLVPDLLWPVTAHIANGVPT